MRRCAAIPGGKPRCCRSLAGLHGFAGRFELARSLFATRAAALDELGRGLNYAARQTEPFVEMLAGNFATAERSPPGRLRRARGDGRERSALDDVGTPLACDPRAGRHDEAERFTRWPRSSASRDDVMTQIVWRGVRARVAAGRGDVDEGERLAREAVTLAGQTDFLNFHADALLDLVAVLDATGRTAETSPIVEEAVRLYEERATQSRPRQHERDVTPPPAFERAATAGRSVRAFVPALELLAQLGEVLARRRRRRRGGGRR